MKRKTVKKIKEFVKNISVTSLVVAIFLGCSWYENHYDRRATVMTVYENIVTVKDECGDEWEFEDDERQYHKDDIVQMTMNSMGTIENFYDDKIENVKKVVNK